MNNKEKPKNCDHSSYLVRLKEDVTASMFSGGDIPIQDGYEIVCTKCDTQLRHFVDREIFDILLEVYENKKPLR